jgi:hypothetical protein
MSAPLEAWRQVAIVCVGRAVFFGSFGIVLFMLGFAFVPVTALRAGAIMSLLMSAILLLKSYLALTQQPRRTEVWLHLADEHRPHNPGAAHFFALTLRDVYAIFARRVLLTSVGLYAASLALQIALKP